MADLAEQIAKANKRQGVKGDAILELDEYDLPVDWLDPEYIAARAIWRNLSEYSVGRADLLHTRNNKKQLWLGHERLKQDRPTLYRLVASNHTIKDFLVAQAFEIIRQHARYLDTSKIIIDDEHYWDKETGEIRQINGDMPAITPLRRTF